MNNNNNNNNKSPSDLLITIHNNNNNNNNTNSPHDDNNNSLNNHNTHHHHSNTNNNNNNNPHNNNNNNNNHTKTSSSSTSSFTYQANINFDNTQQTSHSNNNNNNTTTFTLNGVPVDNFSISSNNGISIQTAVNKLLIGPQGVSLDGTNIPLPPGATSFFTTAFGNNNNNNTNATSNNNGKNNNNNNNKNNYVTTTIINTSTTTTTTTDAEFSPWLIAAPLLALGSFGAPFLSIFFGAPYRRVETLLQINNHLAYHTHQIPRPYTGVVDILKSIRSREGLRGFWRGGLAYMLNSRVASINSFHGAFFMFLLGLVNHHYDNVVNTFTAQPPYHTLTNSFFVSGASALACTPLFYPLHLLNTKMAADVMMINSSTPSTPTTPATTPATTPTTTLPNLRTTYSNATRNGIVRGLLRGFPAYMVSRVITAGGLGALASGVISLLASSSSSAFNTQQMKHNNNNENNNNTNQNNNNNNQNNNNNNQNNNDNNNVVTTTTLLSPSTIVLLNLLVLSCLTTTTYLAAPFSVISTRMAIEAGHAQQSFHYGNMWQCGHKIYSTEGWRPLFAGAGLKMATRVAPAMGALGIFSAAMLKVSSQQQSLPTTLTATAVTTTTSRPIL